MQLVHMDDSERRRQILLLEARVEKLAASIESCRKFMLASKVAITVGALVLLAMTFGAIRFDPIGLIAAITGVIGGAVLLGSNSSTSQQAAADMQTAEAQRAELIGGIDLRLVDDRRDMIGVGG
jgi:hypothetical protein